MKKPALFIILITLSLAVSSVHAQTEPAPPPDTEGPETEEVAASNWERSLRASLTGTQATYRNWSQGGTDNLAVLGSTAYTSEYSRDRYGYKLDINLRYGQTRVGDGDFIKSDDRIRIRNQASRKFRDERLSAIFNLNFESQFDKGYKNPVPEEGEQRELISRFMAPAYITQVLGLSYKPVESLRMEGGVAMKQTIVAVTDENLSRRYFGVGNEDQNFRNEAGLSLLVGYERRVMENIFYSGYVETFTNVNRSLNYTDVLFVNEITGQINRYISANVEFVLAYDREIEPDLQVKQIISLGLSYSFFGD
ncbi:MAG: DUF3078 domain-containing protein [Balneolaceae bacterium]|nr:MAG: DUF3078 domain-containing protein [Balneolaceae bacterium]